MSTLEKRYDSNCMEALYKKMLSLAAPYLKKGRRYDFMHTRLLLSCAAEIARKERLDPTIVVPAFIFHDIGWSQVSAELRKNYRSEKVRYAHMRKGAILTRRLLAKLPHPRAKIARIAHLVSVHDYQSEGVGKTLRGKEELTVASIDFLWRVTRPGFRKDLKELNIGPRQHLQNLYRKAKARKLPQQKTLYRIFLRLAPDPGGVFAASKARWSRPLYKNDE